MPLSQADFNRLVEEHGPGLYRLAYRLVGNRHEAEDAVQETYRSAWSNRAAFDSDLSERAWLATILRRRVIDRWRRQPPRPVLSMDTDPQIGAEDEDPHRDEYSDPVQHALNRLPDEIREALLLVVVGELTHQEAADLLQVPLGTVLSRVSRGRNRLRQFLLRESAQGESAQS